MWEWGNSLNDFFSDCLFLNTSNKRVHCVKNTKKTNNNSQNFNNFTKLLQCAKHKIKGTHWPSDATWLTQQAKPNECNIERLRGTHGRVVEPHHCHSTTAPTNHTPLSSRGSQCRNRENALTAVDASCSRSTIAPSACPHSTSCVARWPHMLWQCPGSTPGRAQRGGSRLAGGGGADVGGGRDTGATARWCWVRRWRWWCSDVTGVGGEGSWLQPGRRRKNCSHASRRGETMI